MSYSDSKTKKGGSKRAGGATGGASKHHPKKKSRTAPTTSTSSSSSNKRAVKHDRQSQRRHADAVTQAKAIWNKLRLKTNTAEQRRALLDELLPLIRGKAHQIALQHDASRVVQAAIQFGTEQERREILEELCKDSVNFCELCKSQYAQFTVLKLIKYCHTDEECLKQLRRAFKGSMPKLAVHAVASRVVESLFTTLSSRDKAVLKQELYGPHFTIFASSDPSDKQKQQQQQNTLEAYLLLAPDRKDQTLSFVRNIVNKGMEKSLYGYTYFQELLAEYVDAIQPNEVRTMAASAADQVLHLLSTRAGTRAAAAFIAYGTAKDRKRILKSLKGYTRSAILHHDAYLAILRLVQLTDDTVSVQKNLLNELLTAPNTDDGSEDVGKNAAATSSLLEIALSDSASKFFLMLLVQDETIWKKYFDPYEHSVLAPSNPTIEQDGEQVPTSRKDADTRRRELLKHLRQPLVDMCTHHAAELVRSRPGSLVLRHVHAAFGSPQVVAAVIEACQSSLAQKDEQESDTDEPELPLLEDFTGHLTIKNLILSDAASSSSDEEEESSFAQAFLDAFRSQLMDICLSNRGAFVVAALCEVPATRNGALEALDEKELRKRQTKDKGSTAGIKALLAAMEGKKQRKE